MRKSKEERIRQLNTQIENFKKAICDPDNFEYDIYNSPQPKADGIRKWGHALEKLHILGVYDKPIWTISAHIRAELKSMGLEKAIVHARRSLPFKYKDPSKIRAEQLITYDYSCDLHERKLTKEEITKENQPYIDLINADIELFQAFIKKLKTTEFLRNIPDIEFNEYRTRSQGMNTLVKESWDKREKILPSQQHLLLFARTQATKSDMFSKYMRYARDIITMTSKQAVRFASGRVTKGELLYEPKNRPEARQAGFYGVPCDECGSWRIDHKYNPEPPDSQPDEGGRNMLFCYACKSWQNIKTEPLMNKVI